MSSPTTQLFQSTLSLPPQAISSQCVWPQVACKQEVCTQAGDGPGCSQFFPGQGKVMSHMPPLCWHTLNPVFYCPWCSMWHTGWMLAEWRKEAGACFCTAIANKNCQPFSFPLTAFLPDEICCVVVSGISSDSHVSVNSMMLLSLPLMLG